MPPAPTSTATTTALNTDPGWKEFLMNQISAHPYLYIGAILALVFLLMFRKPISQLIAKITHFNFKGTGAGAQLSLNALPEVIPAVIEAPKITEATPSEPAPEDDPSTQTEETLARWENPQTLDDWEFRMILAFFERDTKKAEESYEKIKELETDRDKLEQHKITYLKFKYEYSGDQTAYTKLEGMLGEGKFDREIHIALGQCDEHATNYKGALEHFIKASKLAKTPQERIGAKVSASRNYLKIGEKDNAYNLLTEELKEELGEEEGLRIYQGLAELYEADGDNEMKIIALQKAAEIKPSDQGLLFKLGYSASEIADGFKGLSLLNYKNSIKFGSKDEGVLNNLGVQYLNLGMPLKAVNYYKRSAEAGGSLAVANMAYNFMDKGFEEEARELLNKEKVKENPHKNIFDALSALETKKEKEEKSEKDILEQAEKQQKFFNEFSDQYFTPSPAMAIDGVRKHSKAESVLITQTDKEIVISWEEDKKKWRFTGISKNKATKLKLEKAYHLRSSTGEEFYFKEGSGFLYMDKSNGNVLHVMELKGDVVSFYDLTKI